MLLIRQVLNGSKCSSLKTGLFVFFIWSIEISTNARLASSGLADSLECNPASSVSTFLVEQPLHNSLPQAPRSTDTFLSDRRVEPEISAVTAYDGAEVRNVIEPFASNDQAIGKKKSAELKVPLKPVPKAVQCLSNPTPLEAMSFPHPPKGHGHMVHATIQNLAYLLAQYGVTVRYNVTKKKTEILLPDLSFTSDNADNVVMTHLVSLAAMNNMATGQVPAYVEALADRNPYSPVAEWIKNHSWDGTDRLEAIVATITAQESFPLGLKRTLIYRWLLSCVAAVLMPRGFKARGVLTLQGPQGCGKTSWVMSLVPDAVLRELVIKVDHHLDGNNKDSILTAVSHWIVEIGELDSSFKKDIARLKGFLTSDQDKLRRPYARGDSEYARRTVFSATVNERNFLVDMTGNSRWWTIPVTKLNFKHGIDMQQVFAQFALDFEQGEQWWLTAEEEKILELHNKDHQTVSALHERILDVVDPAKAKDSNLPAMTPTEVLRIIGIDRPSNAQCKECGGILRELFGDSKRINGRDKWRVPLRNHLSPTTVSVDDADMY